MDSPVCWGCLERDRIIADLQRRLAQPEAQVERLTRQLEQAQRPGQRQAAPFAQGPPKHHPKKPGRKPGKDYGTQAHRQPPQPEQGDEVHEAAWPDACPDCGGPLDETQVAHQFQVEIPRKPIHRQFNAHVGQCRRCHRRAQGRHPLQTSDALGAAAAQRGPDAPAAVVALNEGAGLPHGKVTGVLDQLFGIGLSRAGSAHTALRAARRCEPAYEGLCRRVAEAPWNVLDETGWHVGGQQAWLHTAVGPQVTASVIDPTRSGDVAERLRGAAYDGALIHGGWSPYDRFVEAEHQQGLAHLLRRCRAMRATATRGAVRFPRRVAELLQAGLDLRDRYAAQEISRHGLAVARGQLRNALADLVWPPQTNAANERLAQHLGHHLDDLFTFLRHPGLDATNWRAELAMRFGVILRKVWGGNRTWGGAGAQAVLMSVWRTCRQQGRRALDWLSQLLRGNPVALTLPP